MKSLLAIALLFAAVCITNPSASAQNNGMKATVPFNFTVGSSHLSAGTYIVSATSDSHMLSIRNKERGGGALALAMPADNVDRTGRNTAKLIFHQYGNQYFLSGVRCNTCSVNVQLYTTKEEKRARVQIQEAGLFVSDPILIALE